MNDVCVVERGINVKRQSDNTTLLSFLEQKYTWNAGTWYLPARENRGIFVSSPIYPNSPQSTKWQTWPLLRASKGNCYLHKRHTQFSWLLKGSLNKRREWNKSLGKMSKSHWIVGNETQHLCPSWAVTHEQQARSFVWTARSHRWWLLGEKNQEILNTSARTVGRRGGQSEVGMRSWELCEFYSKTG